MNYRTGCVVLSLLGTVITGCAPSPFPTQSAGDDGRPASHASPSPGPSRTEPASPPRRSPAPPERSSPTISPEQAARAALDVLSEHHGRYALAVEDLTSGDSVSYGSVSERFASASIIKVDILAALLLQTQDQDSRLTDDQKRLASAMIQESDNDAAHELWIGIGRRAGLDAANERLGLSAEHAGQHVAWGLTQTTVDDQMALLKAVFTEQSPLSSASRAYMRSLMSQVRADQAWGVSAARSPNTGSALKNGWLPLDPDLLWVVNSEGLVQYGGHSLIIVVLTDHQPTKPDGMSLIEQSATAAVHTLVNAGI